MGRPKLSSTLANEELNKVDNQIKSFEENARSITFDEANKAPVKEVEQQTKIASRDLDKMKEIYLKPKRAIGSQEKFNENYRKEYEFAKEFVQFVAENKEIIGESIEIWTKPFAGMPAEEWAVPVNKPVWGPRYLAEQIKRKSYSRFTMKQNVIENSSMGQLYGAMAVEEKVQRLDAHPASNKKSIFMGAASF